MSSGSSVGLGNSEFTSTKANAGGSAFGALGFRPGEPLGFMTSECCAAEESLITDTICSSILLRDSILEGEKESIGALVIKRRLNKFAIFMA